LYKHSSGTHGKTGDHEVHEPANTQAKDAADTKQRNFLTAQVFHQSTVFFVNHSLDDVHDKLAATVLALLILLASVGRAVFLERLGPTFRTRVSHAQSHLPPPSQFVMLAVDPGGA
jgi:hypothetical protein